MINIANETLRTLAEAAKSIPGKARHIKTIHRWRLHGVKGHKLESVAIGGVIYTSDEALSRFFSALSGGQQQTSSTEPSVAQRARRSRNADAVLAARGV